MKVWELGQHRNTSYDTARKFVVRAPNEPFARALASKQCGDEGEDVWLEDAYCLELTADGEAEVVVRDFKYG